LNPAVKWTALAGAVVFIWAFAILLWLGDWTVLVTGTVSGAVLLVAAAAAAILLGALYSLGRQHGQDRHATAWLGLASLVCLLIVVNAVPAFLCARWIVREVRQPVRAMVAPRILARAQSEPFRTWPHGARVPLAGFQALLAQDGVATVSSDSRGSSVMFLDYVTGINAGVSSVYVPDARLGSPPGHIAEWAKLHRDSAHWWTAVQSE